MRGGEEGGHRPPHTWTKARIKPPVVFLAQVFSVSVNFCSVASSRLISPFSFDSQHLAECCEHNKPHCALSDSIRGSGTQRAERSGPRPGTGQEDPHPKASPPPGFQALAIPLDAHNFVTLGPEGTCILAPRFARPCVKGWRYKGN